MDLSIKCDDFVTQFREVKEERAGWIIGKISDDGSTLSCSELLPMDSSINDLIMILSDDSCAIAIGIIDKTHFLFVQWCPNAARVREKMVYAANILVISRAVFATHHRFANLRLFDKEDEEGIEQEINTVYSTLMDAAPPTKFIYSARDVLVKCAAKR